MRAFGDFLLAPATNTLLSVFRPKIGSPINDSWSLIDGRTLPPRGRMAPRGRQDRSGHPCRSLSRSDDPRAGRADMKVGEVMTRQVAVAGPDDTLQKAA